MPLTELLGDKVVDNKGSVVEVGDIAGECTVIGIYFSAHWCPPCRGFTPVLAEWYEKQKGGKLEIVFVSSDRDQTSFDEYFSTMPWKALGFADRERKGKLSDKFGVRGIPTLVFVDKDGVLITKDGRAHVSNGGSWDSISKDTNSSSEDSGKCIII